MMLGENKNEELHIVQKYRANDILIPLGSYHIDLLLEPPPLMVPELIYFCGVTYPR